MAKMLAYNVEQETVRFRRTKALEARKDEGHKDTSTGRTLEIVVSPVDRVSEQFAIVLKMG